MNKRSIYGHYLLRRTERQADTSRGGRFGTPVPGTGIRSGLKPGHASGTQMGGWLEQLVRGLAQPLIANHRNGGADVERFNVVLQGDSDRDAGLVSQFAA